MVSSKELSKEQCWLRLDDSKGTYCRITNETKEDILDKILQAAYNPHILHIHTSFLSSVKRQVFCVRDGLKMVKYQTDI